jgi:hypothetical protein
LFLLEATSIVYVSSIAIGSKGVTLKKIILVALTIFSTNVFAETIFKIEIGNAKKKASVQDLQERVYDLERAVWQLQNKVFELENTPVAKSDSWVCTISAMGDTFTGTGPSKAMATAAAMKDCKTSRGDGFFCKDPKCEE